MFLASVILPLAVPCLGSETPAPLAASSLAAAAELPSASAAFDGTPAPAGSRGRFETYVTTFYGEGRGTAGARSRTYGALLGRTTVPGTGRKLGTLGLQFGGVYSRTEFDPKARLDFSRFGSGAHAVEWVGVDYLTPAVLNRAAAEVGVRMALKYSVEDPRNPGDSPHFWYGISPVAFAAVHIGVTKKLGLRAEIARASGVVPRLNDTSVRIGATISPGRR